jgi:sodium--glutamate symport carrier gltS
MRIWILASLTANSTYWWTPTIVSMTAVTKQYGAAHRAFLLVPLVGGFFIDIINALAINFLANL